MPETLLDPVQPPEAVQLEAFVDCQLSVTACPASIWIWLADTETETFFAGLLVVVLAGAVAGVEVELAGDELAGAAALEAVAGVLFTAALGVLVELAGAAAPPEPPPPPHAACVITMMVMTIERVTAKESIRSMVLDNCG